VRSKAQIVKTASTLKQFSTKIKNAQDEVLTPETVKEIAQEIMEVAEVATELAEEIAGGVPVEEASPLENGSENRGEDRNMPSQIEVAQDEEGEGEGTDDDLDKDKMKEEVASLKNELTKIKRASQLEKLSTKYASLFPTTMQDAKTKEILTSKLPLPIIEAKVQEASDIITNKTMVKVASMTDSVYDFGEAGEEVNIASKL